MNTKNCLPYSPEIFGLNVNTTLNTKTILYWFNILQLIGISLPNYYYIQGHGNNSVALALKLK